MFRIIFQACIKIPKFDNKT